MVYGRNGLWLFTTVFSCNFLSFSFEKWFCSSHLPNCTFVRLLCVRYSMFVYVKFKNEQFEMECRDSFSVFILHYIPILLSHSIRIQLILRLTYLVSRILFMFGIWMFPFYKTDVLFRSISSFSFVELSSTVKCQKWFFFLLSFTLLFVVQSLCALYMAHVSQWEFICHNLFLLLSISFEHFIFHATNSYVLTVLRC